MTSFSRSAINYAVLGGIASARAMTKDRLALTGGGIYVSIGIARAVLELTILNIIYQTRHDLLAYSVVAQMIGAFVFTMLFYNGEVLDRERLRGTLAITFLSPCPKIGWSAGLMMGAAIESLLIGGIGLWFGYTFLHVSFDPNFPSIAVVTILLTISLWGLGLILASIGLLTKRSNQISNLLYPVLVLTGGLYFPISNLPGVLHALAQCLPIGIGTEALSAAMLSNQSVYELANQLVSLCIFAALTPVIGYRLFQRVDLTVRKKGELDLY